MAMSRAFVMTVRLLRLSRFFAISMTVVPESKITVSPSMISEAANFPIICFSRECMRCFWLMDMSS